VHLSYFITITVKKLNYILILFFVGLLSLPLAWGGGKDQGRCPYCPKQETSNTKGDGKSYRTMRRHNFGNITNHVATQHPEEYENWSASRGEKSKQSKQEKEVKQCNECGWNSKDHPDFTHDEYHKLVTDDL
jgi:hypothetical protein